MSEYLLTGNQTKFPSAATKRFRRTYEVPDKDSVLDAITDDLLLENEVLDPHLFLVTADGKTRIPLPKQTL